MDLSNLSTEEIAELQKKNCIFCKIISKEIPSYEIYSDDKVAVILDINPANEGHCLILPKTHYQILPQIPEDIISHISVIAKKTSKSLLKAFGAKGTTIFIANGAIAGQKAPHFMVHVVPRKNNDMLFQINKKNADNNILEEIRKKISERMSLLTGKKLQMQIQNTSEKKDTKEDEKETKEKNTINKDKENLEHDNKKIDIDKISKLFG